MRDHGDVMNNVLRRRDEYVAAKKQKRKTAVKIGTAAACLCVIAAAGIGLWQSKLSGNTDGVKEQRAEDSVIPGMTDTIDDKNAAKQETSETNETNQVTFKLNHLESLSQVSGDIGLNTEDYTAFSREEAIEYYGTNIYPSLPEDINVENLGLVGIFKRDGGTGEVYYSTFEISYYSEDLSRQVNIKGDKGQMPFSCAVTVFDDNQLEATVINGENVYFAEFGDSSIYAEFMYNNVGFEIIFKGLSEEEMISVVSSLIK